MANSRRKFLTETSLGLLGAAVVAKSNAQEPSQPPPGMPSAFGTGPGVGPEISTSTIAEAEKLVQIELTTRHRTQAADTWRVNMAALLERRSGPHAMVLEPSLSPFSSYRSVLPGQHAAAHQMAEATGGVAYFPENVEDVHNICQQVAHDIRNQYTLAYYPTNARRDGSFRSVSVEVIPPRGRGKLVARTRNGYYAPLEATSSGN